MFHGTSEPTAHFKPRDILQTWNYLFHLGNHFIEFRLSDAEDPTRSADLFLISIFKASQRLQLIKLSLVFSLLENLSKTGENPMGRKSNEWRSRVWSFRVPNFRNSRGHFISISVWSSKRNAPISEFNFLFSKTSCSILNADLFCEITWILTNFEPFHSTRRSFYPY